MKIIVVSILMSTVCLADHQAPRPGYLGAAPPAKKSVRIPARCPLFVGETYRHTHQHQGGGQAFNGSLFIQSAKVDGGRISFSGEWRHDSSPDAASAIGTIQGKEFEMTRMWKWEGREYQQTWRGRCGEAGVSGTWTNEFDDRRTGLFSISYSE